MPFPVREACDSLSTSFPPLNIRKVGIYSNADKHTGTRVELDLVRRHKSTCGIIKNTSDSETQRVTH